MFWSFLRLGLRNLFHKNRLFNSINILGLAIGLASLMLVTLFIYDEYNFDRYHRNADRIYRVVLDFESDGNVTPWAKTSASFGKYLSGAYPEVEQVVRLRKNPGTDLLSYADVKFYEERIFFADSALFRVFDFKLLRGDPLTALAAKNSIVLSVKLARKYFQSDDPINKTLRFNNSVDLKITGIMDDVPQNSHFIADAFITFSSLDDLLGEKRLSHWGQFDHYTYVQLSKAASPDLVASKFPDLIKTHAPAWVSEKEKFSLQSLTTIHLHSHRKDEITPNSQERYAYILGTTAIFIFLMACANFFNLSTALWNSRVKEVAVQKMLGADRTQIRLYFWIESTAVCFAALILAFFLAFVTLPHFNLVTGKQLSIIDNPWMSIPFVILALALGFLSGVQPTSIKFSVSAPERIRESSGARTGSGIRNALITFQFAISILLMIASWVVFLQFDFLKSSRLGFESEQVVLVPVKDRSQNDRHATIATKLGELPGIATASFSSSTPGSNNSLTFTYSFTGTEVKERSLSTFIVDEMFFDLYGIKLVDGRLPKSESRDTLSEVIINEAAVKQLQLSQPIGQLVTGKVRGRVVGVIENFAFSSLHSPVEPVILYSSVPGFRFVSVKLKDGEIQTGLTSLENEWQHVYPGYPLEYTFLDEEIKRLYKSEFQLSHAYNAFALIAIFIACMGLIGLTTYLLSRKRKEISIRKVFGGSTRELIWWIYSGYTRIVIVATLFSWGLGYLWIRWWLEGFAFKIEATLLHFIIPVLVMIAMMLVATGWQTAAASRTNPVKNLREE